MTIETHESSQGAEGMSGEEAEAFFVTKPSKRPQNLRKRPVEDTRNRDDDDTFAATINKRVDTAVEEPSSSHGNIGSIENLNVFYSHTGTAELAAQEKKIVTSTAEYDVSREQDRTRIEAKLKATNSSKAGVDTEYRGQSGYRSFITIHDTARANATSEKHRIAGPVRAVANIRMTSRFDYAPDLCKDYNETGFCGFGDSCKFIHDRGDYKSGWELEQEWEAAKLREKGIEEDQFLIRENPPADKVPLEDGPPEVCSICEEPFKKPVVVTRCMHYFCEKCALSYSKTSPLCHSCGTPINGQFKVYKFKSLVDKN